MTELYFVQHGIAESKEVDSSRPLSKKGVNISTQIADHLHNNQINIQQICHSGKSRAHQTAAIFAKKLKVNDISILDGMSPNDDPEILIAKMTGDSAMYVGHLPHIQKVVSRIITGDENQKVIDFQNSAVACIETDGDKGHLKWFITPDICSSDG